MNRILFALLTLGLSPALVLCCAAEPNADQAKAIAEIKKLFGGVEVDEKNPSKPVIAVGFVVGGDVTDATLVYLKGFTQLKRLYLWKTKVTDGGLVNLKELSQLEMLWLDGTRITGSGFTHLKPVFRVMVFNEKQYSGATGGRRRHLVKLPPW